MSSGIGKVVLQLILLHVDSNLFLALNLLGPCPLFLLLANVLPNKAVTNTTILESFELAVFESNLVYDNALSFIPGSWSLSVEILPFACTNDFAISETDFTRGEELSLLDFKTEEDFFTRLASFSCFSWFE